MNKEQKRIQASCESLSMFMNNSLGKKENLKSDDDTIRKISELIINLYKRYYYLPITRIPDLLPSTFLLKEFLNCSVNKKCDRFGLLIDWAKEIGITVNERDPFDLARLLLDISLETCVGVTSLYKEHKTIIMKEMERNVGTVTLGGYCNILRGISELSATQFQHHYIFHLGKTVVDLYKYFKKQTTNVMVSQILRKDAAELEKFRIYVTSKFQPSIKAFLSQLLLLKFHWPLTDLFQNNISNIKGFKTKKPLEPTYLGRITSEIIDAMLFSYYDDTVIFAYDAIVQNYFNILKAFSESILNLEDVGYIESHPSIHKMLRSLNNVFENLSPQTLVYFKKRGIVRLGEIKQDVKDYILTITYLNILAKKKNLSYEFKTIREYDIFKLVLENKLSK